MASNDLELLAKSIKKLDDIKANKDTTYSKNEIDEKLALLSKDSLDEESRKYLQDLIGEE